MKTPDSGETLLSMRASSNLTDFPRSGARLPLPRLDGPRLGILAGAAAVMAALAFLFGAESPGTAIRSDLSAAAGALDGLPQTASANAVRDTMREAFPGRAISVDATGYPALVAVTLHRIDRRDCEAAAQSARRLEGKVVVELDGYGAAADCVASNDMTWRFMP